MYHILYNPRSSGTTGPEKIRLLESKLKDAGSAGCDVTRIPDIYEFIRALPPEDKAVVAGGDGTLNRFVNQIAGRPVSHEIFYYPMGSGNDFALDIGEKPEDRLIPLNRYLRDLPTVDVNGKRYYFVNGVGYGMDGYCCEEAGRVRELTGKPVNYTAAALKALAYAYKPGVARITVDGVTRTYKKVWLAPTMLGRYFGGGMMISPRQDRNDPEQKLSVIVVHSCSRLKMLLLFPSIFRGGHLKFRKVVEVLTGNCVTVEFDHPMSMQIDGETVPEAASCRCISGRDRDTETGTDA